MALFQQTSLTFGEAKTLIAQQASKQSTTEFKTRAGQSLQQAFKYWNRYNWRWRLKQSAAYSVSASATSLVLPYDFKDMYTVRWDSDNPHYLRAVSRRDYDRRWYDQDQRGFPMGYELFRNQQGGLMGFVPLPNVAGEVTLRYYSRMWVPCKATLGSYNIVAGQSSIVADSPGVTLGSRLYNTGACFADGTHITAIDVDNSDTSARQRLYFSASASASSTAGVTFTVGGDDEILDVPEDYENGILAWATGHFLSALGTPPDRLQYFVSLANDELMEARRVNEEQEDLDLAFQTVDEIPLNLINPNATTL